MHLIISGLIITELLTSAVLVEAYNSKNQEGPVFITEPPTNVEFLNTTGASVQCLAHGNPDPILEWVTTDNNSPVSNVPNIREILPNNTLVFYPFRLSEYRQDVHAAVYRCIATNIGGSIISRDVRVRAVVKQKYEIQVYDEFVIQGNTAVLKCQIPNFVDEYVTVTSWLLNEKITIASDPNEVTRYTILPYGALHVRDVGPADKEARFQCRTEHRLTGQSKLSGSIGRILITEPTNSVPPEISGKAHKVSVKRGQMAELSCAAQGYPIPQYTWYKKSPAGKLIKIVASQRISLYGGLMRFTETITDDSNTYVCMVNSTVGMDERHFDLIVNERLSAQIEPERQIIDVGKSAKLKCTVTGYPIDMVTWIKDLKPVYVDGRRIKLITREELHITSVQREDKGMYQCFAYNERQSAQGSAQLLLGDAAPVLLHKFKEMTLQPGPSVSLKCVASGSPLPEIIWTLDGVSLPKHDRILVGDFLDARNGDVTSHVNISNIRVEDGGYYSCSARNKVGVASSGARLNIFGVPFIRDIVNRTVISGKTLTIQCPVAGYPIQTTSWQRGLDTLPVNHAQKTFKNGTLIVENVQPDEDDGQYTCVARNKQGQSARKTLYVKVSVPPMIDRISFPKNLRLVESRRMSIHCTVVVGDLPIEITWHKDGRPIKPDLGLTIRNFETESTLIIRSVSIEHNGTYTCNARNYVANVSRTAVIIVDVPATWITKPQDASVALGSTAFLDCSAKGHPQPEISWRRIKDQDFKLIYNLHPFHIFDNGTLKIMDITEGEDGRYLCQASNDVGKSVSKVITIEVKIPAHFDTKFRNQTVKKGDDTILQCEAFGDRPMTMVWHRDSEPLDAKARKRYRMKEHKTEKGTISEWIITKTEQNDTATFTCKVSNKYGYDEMRIHLVVLEPPYKPVGVRAKVYGSRSATISWKHPVFDGNSPITKYILQYKNHSDVWHGGQTRYHTLEGSVTKMKLGDLKPASKYHARLIAENSEGVSNASEVVQFDTDDDNPEGPPRDVKIDVTGTSTLRVSWKPPRRSLWNGQLSGYHVGYKDLNETSDSYTFQSANISRNTGGGSRIHYAMKDLKRHTMYAIVVQAYNSAGDGPKSKAVTVKTLEQAIGRFPPNKPQLETVSASHTSMTVKWTLDINEDKPVKGYMLNYQWHKDKSKSVSIQASKVNDSAVLGNLTCGTEYRLNMTAYNDIGWSDSSDTVTKSTAGGAPKSPDKDHFINVNTTYLTLDMSTWDHNGCPILGIVVNYRNRRKRGWIRSVTKAHPQKDMVVYIKNLKSHTDYMVRVKANNEAGTTVADYNVKTSGLNLRSPASGFFSGDFTFIFLAVGLIAVIALVLIIVGICLCVHRKKHATEKNNVRKSMNGNNNNKKVELPDVPGPVKKTNNQQQANNRSNRSTSPQRQNCTTTATYENTSNIIYCPKNEELMPYAKMVLGAKMEDAEDDSNSQVEFKTFYMKAGARRTDPPPLPPRDDSLATKIATLRRNPRPPGSLRFNGNANGEQPGDESDIYRDPEDSDLPPQHSSSRMANGNPSDKHATNNHHVLKAQTSKTSEADGSHPQNDSSIPTSSAMKTSSGIYSNTPAPPAAGLYTNFPPPPAAAAVLGGFDNTSYYSNGSIIAQHQAAMMQANPQYQLINKRPKRFVPNHLVNNTFRYPSEERVDKESSKNPPPPSQLRATVNNLSTSDVSEVDYESRDHIATRLHKELQGAIRNMNKPIPQSVV